MTGRWYWLAGMMSWLILAAAGCSKDKPQGKENLLPRVDKILFVPPKVVPGDMVRADVRASDAEVDAFNLEYQWYIDDRPVEGATGPEFNTAGLGPGDALQVEARAVETGSGRPGEWRKSAPLEVGQPHPVKIKTIRIKPDRVYVTEAARAEIELGEDEPEDAELHYRWLINGEAVEDEDSETLAPKFFKAGDRLELQVSSREDFDPKATIAAPAQIVQNSNPVLDEAPDVEVEGEMGYIYISASDPDQQPLTYFLVEGPPSTTIENPSVGTITIDLSRIQPGRYTVAFGVRDNAGGEIRYTTGLTVPEKEKRPR